MKGRQLLRFSAAAVTCAALLVATAGPAWAPRSWGLVNLIAPCSRPGEGSGTFSGTLSFVDFTRSGTDVIANGSITGACLGATISDHAFSAVAEVSNASCDSADLTFESMTLRDITLDLDENTFLIDNAEGSRRVRSQLCSLARATESDRESTKRIVALLNRLLAD